MLSANILHNPQNFFLCKRPIKHKTIRFINGRESQTNQQRSSAFIVRKKTMIETDQTFTYLILIRSDSPILGT
jgi:hypothetical protein